MCPVTVCGQSKWNKSPHKRRHGGSGHYCSEKQQKHRRYIAEQLTNPVTSRSLQHTHSAVILSNRITGKPLKTHTLSVILSNRITGKPLKTHTLSRHTVKQDHWQTSQNTHTQPSYCQTESLANLSKHTHSAAILSNRITGKPLKTPTKHKKWQWTICSLLDNNNTCNCTECLWDIIMFQVQSDIHGTLQQDNLI